MGFLFVNSTNARAVGIPKVKFCVHWVLLWFVPLFKEFFRAVGSIPADAKTITDTIDSGISHLLCKDAKIRLTIVVGEVQRCFLIVCASKASAK